VEDKNVSLREIESIFGSEVADSVDVVSKEELGIKRDLTSYLPNAFDHEHGSVLKLADRNDNISTMVGVFKPERLERYFKETRDEYLPLIRRARRRFPSQEAVYENYKMQIQNQLNLIGYIIEQQKGRE
jgi:(p)ppGpp synthase/HD superfamily hydrolase